MYAVKLRKQWKDGKSCSLSICCLGPTGKSYLFGINLLFAICTSHKIHLVCPPNFCITLVFDSPWVFQWSQEKLKRMLVQNFGEQTRCIMGGVQMVNWPRLFGQDGRVMALFFFVFLLSWLLQWTLSIKMRIKRTLANIQPCWLHERSVRPSSNIELFMPHIIPYSHQLKWYMFQSWFRCPTMYSGVQCLPGKIHYYNSNLCIRFGT